MNFFRLLSKAFYPPKCIHCGKIIPFSDNFCLSCSLKDCRVPEKFCFHCNSRSCSCKATQRRLRHITAPFIYTGTAREIITRLKFRRMKYYGELIAQEIAESVIKDFHGTDFDFVTFVPMSSRAVKRRGYNQSEVIAQLVSQKLFIPCREVLIKTKDTPKQHHLNAESRQNNLADAIVLSEDAELKGKTVLLCDDIKTTGSTLLACEDALISAGAVDVYCTVAAIPVFGNLSPAIDKEDKKT